MPGNWTFIASAKYLLDEDFNWHLGTAVFEAIAKYNSDRERNTKGRYPFHVPAPILHYLDQYFDWQGKQYWLTQTLGEDVCELNFEKMKAGNTDAEPSYSVKGGQVVLEKQRLDLSQQKEIHFASVAARSVATIIDWILCFGLAYCFLEYIYPLAFPADVDSVGIALSSMFLLHAVLILFFELSKYQATPGKMLFGFKVTNHSLERLSIKHGLWRTVCYSVGSIAVYITWIVNYFLGDRMLHDRLSKSYVIDARSYKQ